MTEITRILSAIERGDEHAAAKLLPLVYDELRRHAAAQMAGERPGQTLSPTALVHEAYLRLVGSDGEAHFASRGYFFAAAARAMRRILVEKARRKGRHKHGGRLRRVELPDLPAERDPEPDRLLALDNALTRLAAEDALAAKIVEMRHFAGLGHEAIAHALGISTYLARQKWTYARAWLRDAVDE